MPTYKSHISLRLDPKDTVKIKYIARQELRSVTNKIGYLVHQEVERYEEEHGPIPVSDDDLYN